MFLGIDCSTQSLKLQVINEVKEKLNEIIINYDQDLPHYQTVDGVIRHTTNSFDHISTPTILFIEALELGIQILKSECDLSKIIAISGSGQQHGSVWWKNGASNSLENIEINENIKMVDLLKWSFSLDLSPIWMDSSTTAECNQITECMGSAQKLANITGSRAYERFTGPQIKHLFKHQPLIYENTERISLISSFLASILIGRYAPIDYSDASGMNILDIHSLKWNQTLLETIAPDLNSRLGDPVPSDTKIGLISNYWRSKYGFANNCEIYAFSGDNPCSLIGLNLNKLGDVAISLGTSDVLFGVTDQPKPNANEGSILVHPQDYRQYMMMLVYKNGALTRKFIKDSNFQNDSDWSKFNEAIQNRPVGNDGNLAFYFKETEITPHVNGTGVVKFNADDILVSNQIDLNDCRGIIESQALSYKLHSKLLGLNEIRSLIVTGGGSINKTILQIISDVFECDVRTSNVTNTAASGAAIRALNSFHKSNDQEITNGVSMISNEVIHPISEHFEIYRKLFERYEKLENIAINKLKE